MSFARGTRDTNKGKANYEYQMSNIKYQNGGKLLNGSYCRCGPPGE